MRKILFLKMLSIIEDEQLAWNRWMIKWINERMGDMKTVFVLIQRCDSGMRNERRGTRWEKKWMNLWVYYVGNDDTEMSECLRWVKLVKGDENLRV